MNKRLIIGIFLCVCLAQIITPLSMIAKRESVLKNGEQFKFKTAPVDPYDAFRGRYVALRIAEDNIPVSQGVRLNNGQIVYARITNDDQGFARLSDATLSIPRGVPYIQAMVQYVSGDKVQLNLPIDRYYMEEKSAPAAEKVYREYSRRDKQDAYVLVRIKDGFAVIESLYVGGQKIEEIVKNGKSNSK